MQGTLESTNKEWVFSSFHQSLPQRELHNILNYIYIFIWMLFHFQIFNSLKLKSLSFFTNAFPSTRSLSWLFQCLFWVSPYSFCFLSPYILSVIKFNWDFCPDTSYDNPFLSFPKLTAKWKVCIFSCLAYIIGLTWWLIGKHLTWWLIATQRIFINGWPYIQV